MLRSSLLIFGMTAMLSFTGCDQVFFQANHGFSNKIWDVSDNIRFDVQVTDTLTGYDFYIDLRNEGSYPYANIYMFVNTTFPSGKTARDTVECMLADPSGRWLGKGLGDIVDNHILFKQNIRFPNPGTYTFEFEHGMRMEQLPAMVDMGISLETHRR